MRAYSTDLRRSIIRAYEAGQGSQRHVARVFGVSLRFVNDLLQQYRRTGRVDPKPHSGGHPGKITRHLALVERLQQEAPTASLGELCERFAAETHLTVSRTTMSRALQRLTLEKDKTSPPASRHE